MYWYALVGVLAIAVLIVENYDILFSRGDNQRFPEIKIYRKFLYGILAYYITDVLWGLFDSLQFYQLLYLDTVFYYVAMAVGVLYWTQYVVTYLGGRNAFSRFLPIAGRVCFVAVMMVTVVNIFTPVLFWFDKSGGYHASPARHGQIVFQIILLILTSVYALIAIRRSEGAIRKRYRTICLFGLVVGILLSLQIVYPFLPLYTVGYMLGSCLLHAFVINNEMDELLRQQAERIVTELKQAAKIQTSFLPHGFPAFPDRDEFELYASTVPAKEVGGDFYDYFLVDKDHLALVIADVSGKGIPAAMFMAVAKTRLRQCVFNYGTDVVRAMEEANKELSKDNDEVMFVTVWLGLVDLTTGHVDYVNAGHECPAICSGKLGFRIYNGIHCLLVAVDSDTKYTAGSFELTPGDILFQYTDGITEATDANDTMFQEDRMLEALNKDITGSVKDIDSTVRTAIADFVKDAPQFDDMTTLVFKYKG